MTDDKQKYFTEHVMEELPSRAWRFGKPGTSAYHFRVCWSPGMLSVSGDIGSAVYEVWPAFSTLKGALDLVNDADFDYLTGKSNIKQEFDREETTKSIIKYIYEHLRMGFKTDTIKEICRHYGFNYENVRERKTAFRDFLGDHSLSAETIYNITCHGEDIRYSYPSVAEWTYEALKLWANTVKLGD